MCEPHQKALCHPRHIAFLAELRLFVATAAFEIVAVASSDGCFRLVTAAGSTSLSSRCGRTLLYTMADFYGKLDASVPSKEHAP